MSFQKRSIEFVDKIDPHTKISFAIHIESSIIDTSIAALFYARLPKNDEHQSIGVCIDDDDNVSLCLLLRATAEDDFFEVIVVCIQNTNNSCLCGVEKKKKDIGMCSTIRRTIERTFSDDAHIGFGETTNDDGTKNMPRCCCFRRLERTTRGDSDDESSGRGRGWVVVSRDVE